MNRWHTKRVGVKAVVITLPILKPLKGLEGQMVISVMKIEKIRYI